MVSGLLLALVAAPAAGLELGNHHLPGASVSGGGFPLCPDGNPSCRHCCRVLPRGARQGILFKDGAQLETIGRVRAIAFDKTGTLTTGILQVSDLIPAPSFEAEQVLQTLASLEAYSETSHCPGHRSNRKETEPFLIRCR